MPRYAEYDDALPANAAARVDRGIGEANDAAAPLHEVRSLGCFAFSDDDSVIGGAVGRTWGQRCELQQLWVDDAHRRGGVGSGLLRRFEARAARRGCAWVFLDTFSFQAPAFYRALGYEEAAIDALYPHGIARHAMRKRLAA